MNLLQLEYFLVLAKTENMVETAKNLNVTQPAISAMLKKLETELGLSLFDRHGKSIQLNENGRAFRQSANAILDIAERSKRRSAFFGDSHAEEVLIGCFCSDAPISSTVDTFLQKQLPIQLQFFSIKRMMTIQNIAMMNFCFARTLKTFRGQYYLPIEFKGNAPSYLLIQKTHPLAQHSQLNMEQIAQWCKTETQALRFVQLAPHNNSNSKQDEYMMLQRLGVEPDIRIITDDRFTMASLVAHCGFCSIIRHMDYIPASMLKGLATIPLSIQLRPDIYYLGWPDTQKLSPAAHQFLEFLMEYYNLCWEDVRYANPELFR